MPDKNDKYIDPNTVQIPREMHERKKMLDPKDLPLPPAMGGMSATHRFDILPANPIHEDIVLVEDDDDDDDDDDMLDETGRRIPGKRRRKRRKKSQHANDPSRQRYRSEGGGRRNPRGTTTGDNYLHIYQEQQKQTREEQLKMRDTKSPEQIRQENAQKQKELEMTMRARTLQDQIVWWKQQRGLGQYEDGVVDATIEQLQYELGAIPTGLW